MLQFTNNSIVNVNIDACVYKVIIDSKEITLPITRLSRGEKLLVMCLMAHETESLIYASNELTQLSKESIIIFMDTFKENKHIVLVPQTPTIQHILESLNS